MDIQIANAGQYDHRTMVVTRDLGLDNGHKIIAQPWRYPNEILAIRAGEYNTDPDDPAIMDMVLLEHLIVLDDPYETHPLFATDSEEALHIVSQRIEAVRVEHGAPEEPRMRSLFTAADDDRSTQGLTDTKSLLFKHVNSETVLFGKLMFQETRKAYRAERNIPPVTYAEEIKTRTLGILYDQAKGEDAIRNANGR